MYLRLLGDDRESRYVIGRFAHDFLEQIVRDFNLDEIEIDEIGANLSALERLGVGIISQHRVKLHFRAIGHGITFLPEHVSVNEYCASRFSRWVPGLVPLA